MRGSAQRCCIVVWRCISILRVHGVEWERHGRSIVIRCKRPSQSSERSEGSLLGQERPFTAACLLFLSTALFWRKHTVQERDGSHREKQLDAVEAQLTHSTLSATTGSWPHSGHGDLRGPAAGKANGGAGRLRVVCVAGRRYVQRRGQPGLPGRV